MEKSVAVYVSVLQDSLHSKWEVLKALLDLTQQQEKVLSQENVDTDAFDELMQKKEVLIERLEKLDSGFQELFDKIGTALKGEPQQYKTQILDLQDHIRKITECGVKIQRLEQTNKEKFALFLSQKRKEIREFKVSNKTAVSYYQNMANQHHDWQSYFLDKKK